MTVTGNTTDSFLEKPTGDIVADFMKELPLLAEANFVETRTGSTLITIPTSTGKILKLPGNDPDEMRQRMMAALTGETESPPEILDEPVLSLYNIGRLVNGDANWGKVYVHDVVGCEHRCKHCWVHTAALGARFDHPWMQKKLDQLPTPFRGKTMQSADELFAYMLPKLDKQSMRVLYFTGGETLTYRGGVKRLAELAKEHDAIIGIDTDGYLVAKDETYLDAWEGLEYVIYPWVSIKGVDPVQFQRFTTIDGNYHDYPFVAMERFLERGFITIPGGVSLGAFAHGEDLSREPNSITMLHDRLSRIDHRFPNTLATHRITMGMMVHEMEAQSRRMEAAGYMGKNANGEYDAIVGHWKKKGTPLISEDPEKCDGKTLVQAKTPIIKGVIKRMKRRRTN